MTTQTTTSSTVPTAPAPAPRRLYRSNDRLLGGVAAGLADYAKVDVAVARLAFVALALFAGFGPLLYIIAWIIIPSTPAAMPPAPMAPPTPAPTTATPPAGPVVPTADAADEAPFAAPAPAEDVEREHEDGDKSDTV